MEKSESKYIFYQLNVHGFLPRIDKKKVHSIWATNEDIRLDNTPEEYSNDEDGDGHLNTVKAKVGYYWKDRLLFHRQTDGVVEMLMLPMQESFDWPMKTLATFRLLRSDTTFHLVSHSQETEKGQT